MFDKRNILAPQFIATVSSFTVRHKDRVFDWFPQEDDGSVSKIQYTVMHFFFQIN